MVERVLPFWGLVRSDLRGLPVVLLPGSQFVTQTSTRRNTGAQYTTKALAEEVVRYALEPLVYDPGPQNEENKSRWQLRKPHDLLDLRICDPAVGSGAILTAAGRYLADRLIESVIQYGPGDGPFAERLADLAEASPDEQVVLARREVVDHCLYGVDRNPVAAEMAKLSLWLTTMARERPFTFLDHAIQVGDSLLGITDMEQIRWLHLDPSERKGKRGFESVAIDLRLKEAVELARRVQELSVITVRDAADKQRLHEELQAKLAALSVVADTVVGASLSAAGKGGASLEERLDSQTERIRMALDDDRPAIERRAALDVLGGVSTGWLRTDLPDVAPMPWERRCLHWPLVFPEVFLEEGRVGFDGIVANPPFLGGKRISGAFGPAYREHMAGSIARGSAGSADLVAYFLLRISELGGQVASLATNTVSQGDTRQVGLDRLTEAGWTIHRAVKSEPWPNEANLEIAKLWLSVGEWRGESILDGRSVDGITPSLERSSRVHGPPQVLAANAGGSFIGAYLWGEGFVMSPGAAAKLIAEDPRNKDVLFPYLSGRDLNHDPRHSPSRWVINFFDWPLERAMQYPGCLEIVERLVKPVRDTVNRAAYRERWWLYAEIGVARERATSGLEMVTAIARVSGTVVPVRVPTGVVFHEKTVIFPAEGLALLGLLTSTFHWWWVFRWSSTLGGLGNINYSPTDVFETFPQPEPPLRASWDNIERLGGLLNEFRSDFMIQTGLGLTKTYNRVHDPDDSDPQILRIRELHVELDHAVRDAYGWNDLVLDHHHWETPQGMRFSVSPEAKDELLDRLLELNHERYAAEVAAGLHDKKAKKAPAKRAAKPANPSQESLL